MIPACSVGTHVRGEEKVCCVGGGEDDVVEEEQFIEVRHACFVMGEWFESFVAHVGQIADAFYTFLVGEDLDGGEGGEVDVVGDDCCFACWWSRVSFCFQPYSRVLS